MDSFQGLLALVHWRGHGRDGVHRGWEQHERSDFGVPAVPGGKDQLPLAKIPLCIVFSHVLNNLCPGHYWRWWLLRCWGGGPRPGLKPCLQTLATNCILLKPVFANWRNVFAKLPFWSISRQHKYVLYKYWSINLNPPHCCNPLKKIQNKDIGVLKWAVRGGVWNLLVSEQDDFSKES